jgi:hypothetical protein
VIGFKYGIFFAYAQEKGLKPLNACICGCKEYHVSCLKSLHSTNWVFPIGQFEGKETFETYKLFCQPIRQQLDTLRHYDEVRKTGISVGVYVVLTFFFFKH